MCRISTRDDCNSSGVWPFDDGHCGLSPRDIGNHVCWHVPVWLYRDPVYGEFVEGVSERDALGHDCRSLPAIHRRQRDVPVQHSRFCLSPYDCHGNVAVLHSVHRADGSHLPNKRRHISVIRR